MHISEFMRDAESRLRAGEMLPAEQRGVADMLDRNVAIGYRIFEPMLRQRWRQLVRALEKR